MNLESIRLLCSDPNLIVSKFREDFIDRLSPQQIAVFADVYQANIEKLKMQAIRIEEGKLKDPVLWNMICVLCDLDRFGDDRFSGARLLGRREIDAAIPEAVDISWVPDTFAAYAPLFKAIVFSYANATDVHELIPEDWWGIEKPSQAMCDAFGNFADQLMDMGEIRKSNVIVEASLILEEIE